MDNIVKFDYVSDVHLDSWVVRDGWGSHKTIQDFIRKKLLKRRVGPAAQVGIDPLCDTLVLAGDFGHSNGLSESFLRVLLDKYYKNVVFVAGNHDMASRIDGDNYPSYVERLDNLKERVSHVKGAHFLNGDTVEIDGVTYGGTIGWYDASWTIKSLGYSLDQCLEKHKFWWDYGYIFMPPVFRRMDNFLELMEVEREKIEKIVTVSDVMITHVGPVDDRMAHKYQIGPKAPYSGFFYFDGRQYLTAEKAPKVWVFGHTHDGSIQTVGNTDLVCNPYGYRGENVQPPGILSYIERVDQPKNT